MATEQDKLPDLQFDDDEDLPELDFEDEPGTSAPAPAPTAPAEGKIPQAEFDKMTPDLVGEAQTFSDYLHAGMDATPLAGLAEKAGAGIASLLPGGDYDEIRAEQKRDTAARAARSPTATDLGGVTGALVAPVPGSSAKTWLAALGRLGGQGGMAAADLATRKDSIPDAVTAAKQAGSTAGGFQLAAELAGKTGGALGRFANARAVKALDPTLAQQKVLQSKDAVQDLGSEMLDEGVVRFGSNVESMAPRLEELLGKKGQRIGDIRAEADAAGAQIDFSRLRNKGDAMVGFSNATNDAAKSAAKAYARNAASYAKVPKRSIGEAQEEVMSLNQQIPFNKPNAERTPAQQAYSELRSDITGQMDDQIRQTVPQSADEYHKLKEQFGLFKEADKIADHSVARGARNSDFGLRDLLMANAAKGEGVIGGVKAMAGAAASKLARERGNAAMAVGANKVSQILTSNPKALGKYAQPLMQAAARGNKAMMVTHALLMDDPEYAAMVEGTGVE